MASASFGRGGVTVLYRDGAFHRSLLTRLASRRVRAGRRFADMQMRPPQVARDHLRHSRRLYDRLPAISPVPSQAFAWRSPYGDATQEAASWCHPKSRHHANLVAALRRANAVVGLYILLPQQIRLQRTRRQPPFCSLSNPSQIFRPQSERPNAAAASTHMMERDSSQEVHPVVFQY
jgi:hypothetical protein